MDESFTIKISNSLIDQLANDDEKLKKRSRKPKIKPQRDSRFPQPKAPQKVNTTSEWPAQPPIFLPPPTQSTTTELDEIRSVLQESEKIVDSLQNQGQAMLQEVTKRAKELHDKEFKLPYQKPVHCLTEKDACLECYKEHIKDPLRCANAVKSFQDCARRIRQHMGSLIN